MKLAKALLTAVLAIPLNSGSSAAATVEGVVGDGMTSIAYDGHTGRFLLQLDGQPLGLFQILSASGIFTANATLPPGGLGFDVNTATEKAWAALPATAIDADFDLGAIAPPGLTKAFLLNDLTLTGSGGLGTPNRALDLVALGVFDDPFPTVVDAQLIAFRGSQVTHQFPASEGGLPVVWSNLTPVSSAPFPPSFPTLSASGLFSWNSAGAPLGVYSWDVTATNAIGSDIGRLTVTLIFPEPAATTLAGLALVGIVVVRRRRL